MTDNTERDSLLALFIDWGNRPLTPERVRQNDGESLADAILAEFLPAHDARVRADEREKCARIAEVDEWRNAREYGDEGTPYSNGASRWARRTAAAIRAAGGSNG